MTLNPNVMIDASGVTIVTPRAEMGQGVHTTLAAMVAEEMDLDLGTVRVIHGPASAAYFNAAVQAMDTEIGRLLASVNLSTTTVIFIGDNGTDAQVTQAPLPRQVPLPPRALRRRCNSACRISRQSLRWRVRTTGRCCSARRQAMPSARLRV